MGQNVCFKCGRPRHFVKECPQGVDSMGGPQAQSRVFTLNQEEACKSLEIIQGTVTVNDYLVDGLFDSGASYSFISYDCAKQLGLAVDTLLYDLCVSTPTGMKISTSTVCLNCIIRYAHCYAMLDLIYMPSMILMLSLV
ncbi:uncharacterized protein LOC114740089 [Neltuma alba]|uniref:uncharacterized protein LOC114740089 n=1 Tax=Neltuma alba TaxID=207710 RepID=UPI0010A4153B|nr:uncharacterized protein LOC114740089 [Prosopis alba]